MCSKLRHGTSTKGLTWVTILVFVNYRDVAAGGPCTPYICHQSEVSVGQEDEVNLSTPCGHYGFKLRELYVEDSWAEKILVSKDTAPR